MLRPEPYDPYLHFTASHELINTKVQFESTDGQPHNGIVQKYGQGQEGPVFEVRFDDGTMEYLTEQEVREGNRNYSMALRLSSGLARPSQLPTQPPAAATSPAKSRSPEPRSPPKQRGGGSPKKEPTSIPAAKTNSSSTSPPPPRLDPEAASSGQQPTGAAPASATLPKKPRPPLPPEDVDKLFTVLNRLAAPHFAREFCSPVVDLHPEISKRYQAIVKTPIDLSTVYCKLKLGMYCTLKKFKKDVDQVFENCELYNKSLQQIHVVAYARHLHTFFKSLYMELVKGDPAEKERDRAERLKQCREATLRETDIKPLRELIERYRNENEAGLEAIRACVELLEGSLSQVTVGQLYEKACSVGDEAVRETLLNTFHQVTVTVVERRCRGSEFSSIWAHPADLVWAANKKPPYWPAMVIMYGNVPPHITRINESRMPREYRSKLKKLAAKNPASCVVETFGTHEFMWSPYSFIEPYRGADSEPNSKQQKKDTFLEGVQEIETAYQLGLDTSREDEDEPSRFSKMDLTKVEERVRAAPPEEDDENDDKEEVVRPSKNNVGQKRNRDSADGEGKGVKRRKKQEKRKEKKMRAIEKIKRFVEDHQLREKVLKDLDIPNRPKVKRRTLTTPPPALFSAIGGEDDVDIPALFGGRRAFSVDPNDTDSDFDDPLDENIDWQSANARKAILKRQEQSLRAEIQALQEARKKQQDLRDRMLGHKAPVSPVETSPKPPRKAPVQAKPKPIVSGGEGREKESNATSSYGTSRFIGVCRNGNRWLARISYGGKKHSLGGFDSEKEAALAYDREARLHLGSKAHCNFDESGAMIARKRHYGGKNAKDSKGPSEGPDDSEEPGNDDDGDDVSDDQLSIPRPVIGGPGGRGRGNNVGGGRGGGRGGGGGGGGGPQLLGRPGPGRGTPPLPPLPGDLGISGLGVGPRGRAGGLPPDRLARHHNYGMPPRPGGSQLPDSEDDYSEDEGRNLPPPRRDHYHDDDGESSSDSRRASLSPYDDEDDDEEEDDDDEEDDDWRRRPYR